MLLGRSTAPTTVDPEPPYNDQSCSFTCVTKPTTTPQTYIMPAAISMDDIVHTPMDTSVDINIDASVDMNVDMDLDLSLCLRIYVAWYLVRCQAQYWHAATSRPIDPSTTFHLLGTRRIPTCRRCSNNLGISLIPSARETVSRILR